MRASAVLLTAALTLSCSGDEKTVVVGSKNFTESVILGEIVAQTLEKNGCSVERRLNMGGTFVCHKAIESGAIDTYVEYSGTALTAILEQPAMNDPREVVSVIEREYARRRLVWGPPLGFNNTFAMIVQKGDAEKHGLARISDLAKVPHFRAGFGYEFVERPDGWNGLLKRYDLSFPTPPRTMDLGLTYKALASGTVDLIAGNSTDGLIASLGLVALEDDRRYFPPYDAAVVRRADLDEKCKGASAALRELENSIDDAEMRRMNFEVDGKRRDVRAVAASVVR